MTRPLGRRWSGQPEPCWRSAGCHRQSRSAELGVRRRLDGIVVRPVRDNAISVSGSTALRERRKRRAHAPPWLEPMRSGKVVAGTPARPLNKDLVPVVVCTVAAGWLGFTMEVESFAPDM